jgi:hypothetical protein
MGTWGFGDSLLEGVRAMGNMLDVANALGVRPEAVYLWIAGVAVPPRELQDELTGRLRSALAARGSAAQCIDVMCREALTR